MQHLCHSGSRCLIFCKVSWAHVGMVLFVQHCARPAAKQMGFFSSLAILLNLIVGCVSAQPLVSFKTCQSTLHRLYCLPCPALQCQPPAWEEQ
jgi:hypothetical protein